jgi:hypothetical protein
MKYSWSMYNIRFLQISGITEPWLYIGPGFAGMHQEDGVMNSYNVSVPVSVLPSTDKMLRQHGIDFLKATKVSARCSTPGYIRTYVCTL